MKKFFSENKTDLTKILISVLLIVVASVMKSSSLDIASVIIFVSAYAVIAYEIIIGAVRSLVKEKIANEEMLMTVASLGAMIIGEYFEGCMVMLLYCVGELFEHAAEDSSRRSLERLSSIRPDKARIKGGEVIDASLVRIGDVIEVFPGERIPLDGDVLSGVGNVDTSVMTGESVPMEVRYGSEVLAGYLNLNAAICIKVKRELKQSAAQRIIDLSEKAMEKKTVSEKFIKKFAKIYTPIVIALAVAIAIIPPMFDGFNFAPWVYKALSMLAISCPCAFVISVPLTYFCGIGYASKKGILIKGSCTIDALTKIKAIAFDKTGTITKSELHVTRIDAEPGYDKMNILKYVCIAERKSTHPIAMAIMKEGKKFNIDDEVGENYVETVGKGVECDSRYGHIKAGKKSFVGAVCDAPNNIIVSLDGKFIGSVGIGDELKPNSKIAFQKLKKLGVEKRVILSGDKKSKVDAVARTLLADIAYSELKPEDKLDALEEIMSEKSGNVAYCGDGINDIPSLARADVGIAMGAVGSDSAVESSDVVIMDDDIEKVPLSIRIAKRTKTVVLENIILSMTIKVVMLILCGLGLVSMLWAVVSDVGVLILAILNSLRAGR
ncbi:MAG: heavy metal translocating P-type ATPase [Eubacteriales bacterium]